MATYGTSKQDINLIQTNDTFYAKFKKAGSDDLTVNGSITPVEFTLEDLPDTDFLLQRVTFLIGAEELMTLEGFGNIAALINGVLFSANGDTPLITAQAEIKTNGETMLISSNVEIEAIRISGVTNSVIYGTWDFTETYNDNAPVIKNKDLKIIVRDDLLLMDYFKVSCHGIILS
jgi:hypothetical protein